MVKGGCYCILEGVNMLFIFEVVNVFLEFKVFYGFGKVVNVGGVVMFVLEML